MALKTNSKVAREAIRDSIRADIAGKFSHQGPGQADSPAATAYDALQVLKRELSHEWARRGRHAAFDKWIKGLAFGDLLHAREIVAGWLQQTPDEAERYPNEKSEDLYIDLLGREFFKMAEEDVPRTGWRIDLNPYEARRAAGRGVLFRVDVYRNSRRAASLVGLGQRAAGSLYEMLDRSVKETSELPAGIAAAAGRSQYGSLQGALEAVAEHALDYVWAHERATDAWARRRGDAASYHAIIENLRAAVQEDPAVSPGLKALVLDEAGRYDPPGRSRPPQPAAGADEPRFSPSQIAKAEVDAENGFAYLEAAYGDVRPLPLTTYQAILSAVRHAERAGTCTDLTELTVDGWKQKGDEARWALDFESRNGFPPLHEDFEAKLAAKPMRLRSEGARVASASDALNGCGRRASRDAEQQFGATRPADSTTRPGTSREGR